MRNRVGLSPGANRENRKSRFSLGRKVSATESLRSLGGILASCSFLLALGQAACGGGGAAGPPPPPPPISVSITPSSATLSVSRAVQFTATVSNTANQTVTWQVNGNPGGNAVLGTISASGLYTAPATVPIPPTVSVTAVSQADTSKSASAAVTITPPATIATGVFTYHNDNARTGLNPDELVLTPASVNQARFGKLFSLPVDGYVYAQPLYITNLDIPGQGSRNAVYVATEHDSVFAFDADGRTAAPLWKVSFINPSAGITTVPSAEVQCADLVPEIGITGTPVIDPQTSTLYVVAKTKENGAYFHRLHALDLATGTEKSGGPVVLQASVQGTGEGADSQGNISLDPLIQLQRAALLLSKGVIYIAFASYCDNGPYHGWVLGYDAQTLRQVAVFNATPDGSRGGIWQSGGGPAADASGNVFVVTGNGKFDADAGGKDFGDSFLKLSPSGGLVLSDYFTPFNQAILEAMDLDLGSTSPVLLPDQPGTAHPHLVVGASKEGRLYLLDRDNLGKFHAGDDSQIVQSIFVANQSIFSTPAVWENNLYLLAENDVLKAYRMANGLLSTTPVSLANTIFAFPGATPTVSSVGAANGIVWVVETSAFASGGPAVLHAYDATDLSRELYHSNQAGSRDLAGSAVKFAVATVMNGKVYVGTQNEVTVFGLLP